MKLSIFQPATGVTKPEECFPDTPIIITFPHDGGAAQKYSHQMVGDVPDGQVLVGTESVQAIFYPKSGKTTIRSRFLRDVDGDGIPDWVDFETVFVIRAP